ncbi:ATP F0F1 synthase subunit delta [Corynebacterium atypicum]|uniref:ATP synthase subunit delta n=1 Tax=Corynebacterium atypicum TaxID=191610 RepID=A0ABN4DDB9_9CORY|nr:F0F1 ATP synthase subunit delta [Corynebacterium atypicum]AIG64295.1 ATP F0F1 synthase subunit delta [Corynebacterium atypicum]
MHAASRDALSHAAESIDAIVGDDVAKAAATGAELFELVEFLDAERQLRLALADQASEGQQRCDLTDQLFGGKLAQPTLDALKTAVSQNWSTPRELRDGLVLLARRALLRGAQAEGQLAQVEDELFQLARILEDEPKLVQLLGEKMVAPDRRRQLAAAVLYGKVTKYTEALVLQVIGRPEHDAIDDVDTLVHQVAEFSGHDVAHVVSAGEVSAGQRAQLAEKLGRIYGREMRVHTEIDPELLGGVTVKVGNELIDGSLRGRIARLRAELV